MALLIDTHALVWFGTGDRRLSDAVRAALLSPDPIFISAVTAYEFVDLDRRGRFPARLRFDDVAAALTADVLDYPAACAAVAGLLPGIHRDPIDRMVIAHAIHADLILVTADADMRRYPVRTIW